MTQQKGQVALDGAAPVEATVEPGDAAVTIVPAGADPIELPYVDVVDLHDDDYTLRLTDHTGRRYELSMLGKAYGQVLGEIRARRDDALQKDLLLTGVRLQDTYPGKLFGGPEPAPVEIRLFEDSLVVIPERAQMFGVPYSFVEDVAWDEDAYQLRVRADDGTELVLGHFAKRSEELRDELLRLMDALATRTAATLQGLLPGTDAETVGRLATVMRDGRAAQKRAVDTVDPDLWPQLEDAVVGTTELRESYEHLKTMSPEDWVALGVKAVKSAAKDADASEATGVADGGPQADQTDEASDSATHMWFFAPLLQKGNAVAHEITSEPGHATYLYRAVEPDRFAGLRGEDLATAVAAGMAKINRAILALNFRREPIYASDEELRGGRFARYRVAVRSLDHLRFAREQFLGRAIHNAGWAGQVEEALGRA